MRAIEIIRTNGNKVTLLVDHIHSVSLQQATDGDRDDVLYVAMGPIPYGKPFQFESTNAASYYEKILSLLEVVKL